jgi:hypothetical protein
MASTSASKAKAKKAQPSAEDKSSFGPIAERFRRAGDLERAVSLCREGLNKFPDNISARVTLGWALLELGKFDESRVELEQVLRRRPDNLAAIRALAELHDRAEHTLNLPMDGPGQWPPSPEKVDEMAGGMVADHFRGISEDESLESAQDDGLGPASPQPQPATVPPAELGLAMWSALPPTAPVEAEASAHLSISPNSVPDPVAPDAAAQAVGPDIDIAALLAEVESLEAMVDVPAPAAQAQEVSEAEPPTAALSEAAFVAEPEIEATLELGSEPDLAAFDEFQPAAVASVEAAQLTAEPVEVAAAEELIAAPAEVAGEPPVEVTAAPVEPGFELEGLSIAATEAAADPLAVEEAPTVEVADDTQPILRFDLEPVAEPVAAEPVEGSPVAAYQPEPVAAAAMVVPEAVVESAVISSVQARIAEVVAMARHTEPVKAQPKPSLVALENFLSRVQARRRTMAESVA